MIDIDAAAFLVGLRILQKKAAFTVLFNNGVVGIKGNGRMNVYNPCALIPVDAVR